MSYLTFHLIFIIPPILFLGYTQPRPLAGVTGWRPRFALTLTCLIAFAYTTPWDNYLIYRGVWAYGTERVIGVVGYVPVEEYLFFILQPVLVGLFLYRLLGSPVEEPGRVRSWLYALVLVFYLAITAIGVWALTAPQAYLYLGLILAWAGPVLLGLWLYGGRHYTRYPRTFALAVAVPTLYLWIADAIAIRLGIWQISETYTTGLHLFGLPVEEAVFFLVTTLLVVQGVLLFLHGDRIPPPFRR